MKEGFWKGTFTTIATTTKIIEGPIFHLEYRVNRMKVALINNNNNNNKYIHKMFQLHWNGNVNRNERDCGEKILILKESQGIVIQMER